jgi:ABC-2 type transport system ATP-binding protein
MGFYPDLNAVQMLRFVAELNGLTGSAIDGRIADALHNVGLAKESEKKIGAYSRGMRQRLGVAELLIKDSKVAFLDEPTLGLDPDATNRIMELIKSLCRDKKMTVLLSSHMLHQVQKICSRVGIMIKGQMVAQGPMERLAREKLGIGQQTYSLEEIYMKYFRVDCARYRSDIKKRTGRSFQQLSFCHYLRPDCHDQSDNGLYGGA